MKRTSVVMIVLVVAALGLWLFTGQPAAPRASPAEGIPQRPAEAFALTVSYVFDGDTIEARIQDPDGIVTTTEAIRVRLIGIDTPEGAPRPECWADEARDHLASLLPVGATAWAAEDSDLLDRFGRSLLYLWTDSGVFVNHALVARGDAEAIRIGRNDAHFGVLSDAEADARAAGAGRWGACG